MGSVFPFSVSENRDDSLSLVTKQCKGEAIDHFLHLAAEPLSPTLFSFKIKN